MESPLGDCEPSLRNSDSGHFCHSPQHPPFSVQVSDSGATSTGGRCSVSGLAGVVNVHVFAIPLAQQSHSETMCHSEGRRDPNSPLVVITAVVSTCVCTTLCTESCTICTHGGSLMQYYKAAGF